MSFIVNTVFYFFNYKTFNYKLNYISYSLYIMQALSWLFCCCDDYAYSSWKSEIQFKFKEQTIHTVNMYVLV